MDLAQEFGIAEVLWGRFGAGAGAGLGRAARVQIGGGGAGKQRRAIGVALGPFRAHHREQDFKRRRPLRRAVGEGGRGHRRVPGQGGGGGFDAISQCGEAYTLFRGAWEGFFPQFGDFFPESGDFFLWAGRYLSLRLRI
jgi:hypothetical protein